MRDFYKQILKHSHQIWGRHQLNTIYKDKTEEEGNQDLVYLLDGLCRVSEIYAYIPDEAQKDIINKCLITEEYENINMREVSGWLKKHGDKYFKEVAHVETKPAGEIVTGEARDKWLDEFAKAVLNTKQEFTQPGTDEYKGNGAKMKEQLEANGLTHDKKTVSALEAACGVTEEMKEQTKPE